MTKWSSKSKPTVLITAEVFSAARVNTAANGTRKSAIDLGL